MVTTALHFRIWWRPVVDKSTRFAEIISWGVPLLGHTSVRRPQLIIAQVVTALLVKQCCNNGYHGSTMLLSKQCCSLLFQQCCSLLFQQCCSLLFRQCCLALMKQQRLFTVVGTGENNIDIEQVWTVIMAEQCCWANNVVHYCFTNVVQHWRSNNGCSYVTPLFYRAFEVLKIDVYNSSISHFFLEILRFVLYVNEIPF